MSAPDREALLRRSPGVLHRRFGASIVLLVRGEAELRRLEGPAAATWAVLDAPRRFGDLVDEAAAAVEADGGRMPASAVVGLVAEAVDALRDAGVLVVEAPSSGAVAP